MFNKAFYARYFVVYIKGKSHNFLDFVQCIYYLGASLFKTHEMCKGIHLLVSLVRGQWAGTLMSIIYGSYINNHVFSCDGKMHLLFFIPHRCLGIMLCYDLFWWIKRGVKIPECWSSSIILSTAIEMVFRKLFSVKLPMIDLLFLFFLKDVL